MYANWIGNMDIIFLQWVKSIGVGWNHGILNYFRMTGAQGQWGYILTDLLIDISKIIIYYKMQTPFNKIVQVLGSLSLAILAVYINR